MGRKTQRDGATEHTPPPPTALGYHHETVPVADPDLNNIRRIRALNHQTGRGLQGYAGEAVNYDQGDPARSLTHVIEGTAPNPTDALAAVARPADATRMAPVAEYADQTMNSSLDPYQALLFARITR